MVNESSTKHIWKTEVITEEEVSKAVCKLCYGRAAGEDGVIGKFYNKCGAPIFSVPLANMFNNMFATQ